ncbi:hypothetical protein HPB47_001210 [Ixodes persulcatus]|uniref:Uncharacterized protein n=1 Tax=Ixodes persulcatus TaxID=34615 RepID=A0AC60PPU3_IXOPE|nr:hypothetical protein HPB47_001210 [Ixodes persulcatus]
MTDRISQDTLKQLFGVAQHLSRSNDHPTPVQFLLSFNTLSFMNLAKSPESANISPGLLSTLLQIEDSFMREKTTVQSEVDQLLDAGNLVAAHDALICCDLDHSSLVTGKSNSRLIFYVAGYIARKFLAKCKCDECLSHLLMPKRAPHPAEASLTSHVIMGWLLYPSQALNKQVSSLENTFTRCVSVKQLRRNSLTDLASFLQLRPPSLIGCEKHKVYLTNHIVKFYSITRLHFLVKGKKSTPRKCEISKESPEDAASEISNGYREYDPTTLTAKAKAKLKKEMRTKLPQEPYPVPTRGLRRYQTVLLRRDEERPGDLGAWIRPPEEDEETRLRVLRSVVFYMEKTGLSQSLTPFPPPLRAMP